MSVSEPQPPAVIAEFNSYTGLIDAVRARSQERRDVMNNPNAVATAGMPSLLAKKLLSKDPIRRVNVKLLGPILNVLGCRLVMVEDSDAAAKYTDKLPKRNEHCAHDGGAVHYSFSRKFISKIGANGGANSRKNLGKRMSKQLARHAANSRWIMVATEAAQEAAKAAEKEAARTLRAAVNAKEKAREAKAEATAARAAANRAAAEARKLARKLVWIDAQAEAKAAAKAAKRRAPAREAA
jgi:hypothetical protein